MDHPVFLTAYTRTEAIAHGLLVDVTEAAAAAGITLPVAMTWPAWSAGIEWTPAGIAQRPQARDPRQVEQLVRQFAKAIKAAQTCPASLAAAAGSNILDFEIDTGGRHGDGRAVVLPMKAVIAPEGNDAPAITIMLSDEY